MSRSELLTDQQVTELRQRYAAGNVTLTALAQEYGISKQRASQVVRGKTYAHLPGATSVGHDGKRKLTPAQVAEARQLYRANPLITHRELAARYGVAVSTVHGALTGRTFADMAGIVPTFAKKKGPRGPIGKRPKAEQPSSQSMARRKARAQRLAMALAEAVGQPYVVIVAGSGLDVVPEASAPAGAQVVCHVCPT